MFQTSLLLPKLRPNAAGGDEFRKHAAYVFVSVDSNNRADSPVQHFESLLGRRKSGSGSLQIGLNSGRSSSSLIDAGAGSRNTSNSPLPPIKRSGNFEYSPTSRQQSFDVSRVTSAFGAATETPAPLDASSHGMGPIENPRLLDSSNLREYATIASSIAGQTRLPSDLGQQPLDEQSPQRKRHFADELFQQGQSTTVSPDRKPKRIRGNIQHGLTSHLARSISCPVDMQQEADEIIQFVPLKRNDQDTETQQKNGTTLTQKQIQRLASKHALPKQHRGKARKQDSGLTGGPGTLTSGIRRVNQQVQEERVASSLEWNSQRSRSTLVLPEIVLAVGRTTPHR